MDYYFGNSNPNPYSYGHSSALNMAPASPEFMLSDYLMLDDHVVVDHHDQDSWSQSTESSEKAASSDASHGFGGATTTSMNNNIKCKNETKRSNKIGVNQKIAFRTKSELEIMDDGYKWRKYGKKSVKNSPNPRNYYKCSSEGCKVKKRVERDREDSCYVLTTYEGVHNHERPYSAYYSEMPKFVHISNDWALRTSANASS